MVQNKIQLKQVLVKTLKVDGGGSDIFLEMPPHINKTIIREYIASEMQVIKTWCWFLMITFDVLVKE